MGEEVQPINIISSQEGMPKIYKWLIIGIIVAIVLIAGLVVMKFSLMKQTSDIKDCKESLKCFTSAIEDGKLSKAMFTTTVDILGMKQTSTNYMELRNCEDNNCLFYISYVNASAEFAPGTPQVAIDASKPVYEALKGKNGTCIFEKEDLISMLNNWEAGNFSTEDFSVANCSGDYFGWSEVPSDNENVANPSVLVVGDNVTSCSESWQCGSWSSCANNQQTRICTDSNDCGTLTNKPSVTQGCTINQICTESWTCLGWSTCAGGEQTRICTDSNNCGTVANKPITTQTCVNPCSGGWTCYDNWSPCSNGLQTRTCTPANAGCEPKVENRTCTSLSGPVSVSWSAENNQSYSDPRVNINAVDYTPYYSACSHWCTLVPGKGYSGCESSANSGVNGERVRWDGSNWQIVSASDSYSDYITVFNCKI